MRRCCGDQLQAPITTILQNGIYHTHWSDIIKQEVTDHLDHSNLNLDVEFIPPGMQPTTENLVILIWQRLVKALEHYPCQLHAIKLWETETIYAEYYGE
ncbi:MAG: 6-carboxytetrahydropterin synthase [Lewinellaceae bacterium]|nr:6-carboxytetrahydropterin synthase [Lewinellaceae bacterium]